MQTLWVERANSSKTVSEQVALALQPGRPDVLRTRLGDLSPPSCGRDAKRVPRSSLPAHHSKHAGGQNKASMHSCICNTISSTTVLQRALHDCMPARATPGRLGPWTTTCWRCRQYKFANARATSSLTTMTNTHNNPLNKHTGNKRTHMDDTDIQQCENTLARSQYSMIHARFDKQDNSPAAD